MALQDALADLRREKGGKEVVGWVGGGGDAA